MSSKSLSSHSIESEKDMGIYNHLTLSPPPFLSATIPRSPDPILPFTASARHLLLLVALTAFPDRLNQHDAA